MKEKRTRQRRILDYYSLLLMGLFWAAMGIAIFSPGETTFGQRQPYLLAGAIAASGWLVIYLRLWAPLVILALLGSCGFFIVAAQINSNNTTALILMYIAGMGALGFCAESTRQAFATLRQKP